MSKYKIFHSPDGDWQIAVKKEEGSSEIEILYEGHHTELALEAILDDQGIQIDKEERDMDSGTYEPTITDF